MDSGRPRKEADQGPGTSLLSREQFGQRHRLPPHPYLGAGPPVAPRERSDRHLRGPRASTLEPDELGALWRGGSAHSSLEVFQGPDTPPAYLCLREHAPSPAYYSGCHPPPPLRINPTSYHPCTSFFPVPLHARHPLLPQPLRVQACDPRMQKHVSTCVWGGGRGAGDVSEVGRPLVYIQDICSLETRPGHCSSCRYRGLHPPSSSPGNNPYSLNSVLSPSLGCGNPCVLP